MKKFYILPLLLIQFSIFAQNVNIPDANFKAALLANTSINTDANKFEISVAEAGAFTGEIGVSRQNIRSLVGIEAFTALTRLACFTNQLTVLDITKNTALKYLTCSENQLTVLDITKNTALEYLSCFSNQLTSLDIRQNTALTYLSCYDNKLTVLDVTKNTALTFLNCYDNKLTSLDVTMNSALTTGLYCSSNQITTLDVTKNTALKQLDCSFNQITSLDVTKNIALNLLDCGTNQLRALDLSKNTFNLMWCSNNPNLTCIQALNTQVKTNWTKDASATYNETCTTSLEDENQTISKTISKIYTVLGQEVNNTYQGLVIIQYNDGSTKRIMQ